MKKENLDELRQEIYSCAKKIKEFEPYIEADEAMKIMYNQAIVDKAVLIKRAEEIYNKENLFKKIKTNANFGRKNKLICDYFMK